MTINLEDIERLEHQCVRAMARADITPMRRTELAETLQKIRALKREYLTAHPSVLRKVTREPAPGDRPNAISPDRALGSDAAPLHFRAPAHLRDLVLHLSTGHALTVPASGVVEIAAHHVDVQTALREQGFSELRGIDRSGKATDGGPDPAAAFDRSRLTRIGGGDADLLRALGARAIKAAVAPIERRVEPDGGPGPALTYCRSLEEFHRRFFGRSF
jgi:hypothetical protein